MSVKHFVSMTAAGALEGLLVLVLLGVANPLALHQEGILFPDGTIQTTAARSDNRRAFYLTDSTWDGGSALSACAEGFHMASLFEILDVSNLRYAREIGDSVETDDAGTGPPSNAFGWVRTGENSGSAGAAGQGNCNLWTGNSPERDGSSRR